MLYPVKIYEGTKELCWKDGLKYVRTIRKEELLQMAADSKKLKKIVIHPSVKYLRKKEDLDDQDLSWFTGGLNVPRNNKKA